MANKIYNSILSVALAVLLASFVIITAVIYQYFAAVQQAQLKDELALAAAATEQLGQSYLESISSDGCRMTWVAADGAVIYDSRAQAASMENHADREEIKEALSTGAGSGARMSSTLTEKTIYEAQRLSDGSVLRISASRASALTLALGMLSPLALVLICAMALSAALAHRMARRVVEPLNSIDLDAPMSSRAYEELTPLLRRLHAQQQQLKHNMQLLARRQEEFELITGSMREALVLLDGEGRLISINPSARALFNAESLRAGEAFAPPEALCAAIDGAQEHGHAACRAQLNGRTYQFELSRIARDESARGTAILAFDVTEQARAERERQAFTANVSHELKTPLQTIIGSAELLEGGVVRAEDVPRFVGHIRKEAARLLTLIDDIIRLSQLDEGAALPQEEVALRALAEEVWDELEPAARARELSFSIAGDEGRIRGVPRLLHELIYNLCDNAIKYNRPGGSVGISIAQGAQEVCLTVADTGVGIAPEHQQKIFERFYRVDKSRSKQSGGTGLGLSIVKHAAQYHDAAITLESEVGSGTRIHVHFPCT